MTSGQLRRFTSTNHQHKPVPPVDAQEFLLVHHRAEQLLLRPPAEQLQEYGPLGVFRFLPFQADFSGDPHQLRQERLAVQVALEQVVVDAQADRPLHVVELPVSGQEQDVRLPVDGAYRLREGYPVHPRHPHVADDQVRHLPPACLQGLVRVQVPPRDRKTVCFPVHQRLQVFQRQRLVIQQKNTDHFCAPYVVSGSERIVSVIHILPYFQSGDDNIRRKFLRILKSV